ncbi:MAG: glycoside hydrolase family 13 protein [Ignavibacteriales bacterium]|nr:MAG: glycoside hydrolase family 13 protein [Ignavibacteriales bacterium]
MKTKTILCLLISFCAASVLKSQSAPPEWAKGIVWYQVFPERFANGDLTNDPEAGKVFINSDKPLEGWEISKWTSDWFSKSGWEKKAGQNVRDHMYERRYGGDIQGLINRLDYIKSLGAGAIYLNPVFEAVSLHKYDGSTFHHIDVNFGPDPDGDRIIIESEIPDDPSTWKFTSADSLFFKLVDEVHKRGMKIIIDGVFNHVGVQFWAFKDLVRNQAESNYRDWFIVRTFDDPSTTQREFNYKGWWNIASLPEFNRTENDLNPGPKQYVFHATKKWMDPNNDGDPSDGIDGWRLDVAREVPLGFWRDWNHLVKSINRDAIIIGELWELSPDFISANGVFDALMNYNFAFAVNDFFIAKKNKINVSEFIQKLKEIDKNYPAENLDVLQNLIGSHDTERLSSLIFNPDRGFDRYANEGNQDYNPSKPTSEVYEKQKQVLAFQMTYKGAPMIYYGDEVGMWGADDPHCRKPMVWSDLKYDDEIINSSSGFKKGFGKYSVEQDTSLFFFYKKMISIRNSSKALQKGALNFLYSNDDNAVFAFERILGDEKVIVVFNTGSRIDNFTLPIDIKKVSYMELISGVSGMAAGTSGNDAVLNISIAPNSVQVYKLYPVK